MIGNPSWIGIPMQKHQRKPVAPWHLLFQWHPLRDYMKDPKSIQLSGIDWRPAKHFQAVKWDYSATGARILHRADFIHYLLAFSAVVLHGKIRRGSLCWSPPRCKLRKRIPRACGTTQSYFCACCCTSPLCSFLLSSLYSLSLDIDDFDLMAKYQHYLSPGWHNLWGYRGS